MPSASEKIPLTDSDIEDALTDIDGWVFKGQVIERVFKTATFDDGMALLNKIAVAAEALRHHPDVFLSYSRLKIHLMTHDVNGITALDLSLAGKINELALAEGIF